MTWVTGIQPPLALFCSNVWTLLIIFRCDSKVDIERFDLLVSPKDQYEQRFEACFLKYVKMFVEKHCSNIAQACTKTMHVAKNIA